MDRVDQYRKTVRQFLRDFAEGDPEAELVFDVERDRYLVLHPGWRGERRIYGCALHFDVTDGKVWIQHNSTEIDVYQELIEQGVAAKDLVLGFRSPAIRELLAAALN